jgi:transcriptional regulator with XRE-family HTH domain
VDNIGQRLREERQLRGWSQRDLARETGVNVDTISGIETSQHEPRPSTLRKLAEGLGIEVRDFFAEPALPKAEARETGQPEDRGFTTRKTREFLLPQESPARVPTNKDAQIAALQHDNELLREENKVLRAALEEAGIEAPSVR